MKTRILIYHSTFAFAYMLLAVLLFVGCEQVDNQKKHANLHETTNTITLRGGDIIHTLEIDSCEYILYDGFRAGNIIHKENCRFCRLRKNIY